MGFFQTSGILNRRGFLGGAAKAFSPTDIAGLQLWLDATTGLFDATSGGNAVTTDGSAVARWEDQSGNGNHFTQSTANNRPVLKVGHKNSKNTIFFDGSNDWIGASILINAPFTVVAVAYPSKDLTLNAYRIILSGNSNDYAIGYDNSSRAFFYTTTGSQSSRAKPFNYELYIPILNASSSKFLINNNFNGAWSVTNINLNSLRLANNFFQSYENYFAEVLAYNSVVSDSNIVKIKDYLNTKWSIY